MRRRQELVRVAAPVVFLLAATVAILLVRSGLDHSSASPQQATTTKRQPRAHKPAVVALEPTTHAANPPATTAAGATYTVKSGDTLATIAASKGTTVDALLAANPGVDPTGLQIGQAISLP